MQRYFLSVLILSTCMITSCGSDSLEDSGRDLGERRCECESIDWRYDTKAAEAAIDAMKADATMNLDSAIALGRKILEGHRGEKDRQEEICENELEKMTLQVAIDFPKDEDRKTLENLLDAMHEQCRQRHRMEMEKLDTALREMRERIQ